MFESQDSLLSFNICAALKVRIVYLLSFNIWKEKLDFVINIFVPFLRLMEFQFSRGYQLLRSVKTSDGHGFLVFFFKVMECTVTSELLS